MLFKRSNGAHVLTNLLLTKQEPISVVHFVTNRCNARCSFCFIDFDDPKTFAGELTIDEIDKLTKNLGSSLLNVNITGGEPFARKDLVEIAKKYLTNTTIQSIYITTNASLPDRIKNFAEKVSEFRKNVELTFQISIDDFPEEHNKVRKIKDLFDNCIESYRLLKAMGQNINPVVSITVTHENCDNIKKIFNYLYYDCKIDSIKCTIVRDEGVYKTPSKEKVNILNSYNWLTNKIIEDCNNKILDNYDQSSAQGRLHFKKDRLLYKYVSKYYLKPFYQSPCPAGRLFGIIDAKVKVFACEILDNDCIGSLRENNMDFMKLWNDTKAKDTRKWIKDTKCNCHWECIFTYNLISSPKYTANIASKIIKAKL